MALAATDRINGLKDAPDFDELSTLVGTLYAAATGGNAYGLSMSDKFNSLEDEITVNVLTAFIKQQVEVPTVSTYQHAAVTATQKTNGTIDVTTLGHVVKYIMEDNSWPL